MKDITLNLLYDAGIEPTVEEIMNLNYLGEAYELDAERLKSFKRAEKMRDGSGEAIELPHHDCIEPPAVSVGQ